jgi:hypothetical protein
VDPFSRAAHEFCGTFEHDPSRDELEMLELQHREEGHYIVSFCTSFRQDDEEAGALHYDPVWFVRCTCGEGNWYDPDRGPTDEPVIVTTMDECRAWARAHREYHGLPWQPWLGYRPAVVFWAATWEDEGHCVCAVEATDGSSFLVACTCGRDLLDELGQDRADEVDQDEFAATTSKVSTYDDAMIWAAEHRGRFGLDPQPEIAGFGILELGAGAFLRP